MAAAKRLSARFTPLIAVVLSHPLRRMAGKKRGPEVGAYSKK